MYDNKIEYQFRINIKMFFVFSHHEDTKIIYLIKRCLSVLHSGLERKKDRPDS